MLLELEEKEKNFQKEPAKNIFKTLIYIAVPITIGVSILPIMNIADVTIVMQRMQDAGFSTMEANALYGQLTGLAGPIINIPMALGLSIALSMVPAIASAHMTKDVEFLKENTKLGLRTAMIVGECAQNPPRYPVILFVYRCHFLLPTCQIIPTNNQRHIQTNYQSSVDRKSVV